ncbi:alkylated DNA repair protein alkB homolog 8-like [Clytia hemisphaerica]|uniref:Methyltransferase type 11 domain-containing protein n=1 Tax=Clytia hemisphaerica TaxID=252671 RepID=A0A7M5V3V6_9CNID
MVDMCKTKVHDFEKKYVHDVYDRLSVEESSIDKSKCNLQTRRGKCWRRVIRFLQSFPMDSLIGDIGFGDGRFLDESQANIFGIERCIHLCEEAKKSNDNIETIGSDVTQLPFRSNLFDGLICVAVLHHLATKRRRINAFKELGRVMRVGGQLLFTVCAMGDYQDQYGGCDVLIPTSRVHQEDCTKETNKNNTSPNTDAILKKNTPIGSLISETKEKLCSNIFPEIQSWLKNRGKDKITHNLGINRKTDIEEEQKYYHIFTQKEITDILESVGNLEVTETQHYKGSWVYIVTKTS